jgi:GMP synthase-like glutamine amidotransferase
VASSDYCPFASLEYNFPAFSVQYHPEFTKEYFKKLLMAGEGIFLSSKQTQRTLTEIKKDRVPRDADLKKVTELLSNNSQDRVRSVI